MTTPATYDLTTPLQHRGKTITQITMRRPTMREMLSINRKKEYEGTMKLLQITTGVPRPALDELAEPDLNALCVLLTQLIEGGHRGE